MEISHFTPKRKLILAFFRSLGCAALTSFLCYTVHTDFTFPISLWDTSFVRVAFPHRWFYFFMLVYLTGNPEDSPQQPCGCTMTGGPVCPSLVLEYQLHKSHRASFFFFSFCWFKIMSTKTCCSDCIPLQLVLEEVRRADHVLQAALPTAGPLRWG